MKVRMDRSSEEERSVSSIAALFSALPFHRIGITAALGACLLAGVTWSNCAAYNPSEEGRLNPPSIVLEKVFPRGGRERVETIGHDEPPTLSGAPRGVSVPFKRRQAPDMRKPLHSWFTHEGVLSGDMAPRPGSGRKTTDHYGKERATQEIGLYGWSQDLRRYATLVFDRDQRILADRLTREPVSVDSIKAISPFPPASALPEVLQWPELNSYEIWVAELLGL